jgi:uncharacterized protein YjiS (DUF1127 family)
MAALFRPAGALYRPEGVGEKVAPQQFISSTTALGWLRTLRFWIGRRRQRRAFGELSELNNYLLRDIGVPEDELVHELAELLRR